MVSQKVKIQLKFGLHARPAGVLAKMAQQYVSDVNIQLNNTTHNAKSVMGVLSVGANYGTEIELVCNGKDESKALQELVKAINSGLEG